MVTAAMLKRIRRTAYRLNKESFFWGKRKKRYVLQEGFGDGWVLFEAPLRIGTSRLVRATKYYGCAHLKSA